ncbi:MAG: hypothetical protein ABI216_10415, partial [Devosia sp.]
MNPTMFTKDGRWDDKDPARRKLPVDAALILEEPRQLGDFVGDGTTRATTTARRWRWGINTIQDEVGGPAE